MLITLANFSRKYNRQYSYLHFLLSNKKLRSKPFPVVQKVFNNLLVNEEEMREWLDSAPQGIGGKPTSCKKAA
jgi:hypothetical protein